MNLAPFFVLSAIFTGIADYLLKTAADRGNTNYLFVSFVFYIGTSICWYRILQSHGYVSAAMIYSVSILIMTCFLSYYVFGEAWKPRYYVGITFALATIYCMRQ